MHEIDNNECKRRRIKGREGEEKWCFEYLIVDVSRLQTIGTTKEGKLKGQTSALNDDTYSNMKRGFGGEADEDDDDADETSLQVRQLFNGASGSSSGATKAIGDDVRSFVKEKRCKKNGRCHQ